MLSFWVTLRINWVIWSHFAILGHLHARVIFGLREKFKSVSVSCLLSSIWVRSAAQCGEGGKSLYEGSLNILNNSRPAYRVPLHLHHLTNSRVRDNRETNLSGARCLSVVVVVEK